MGTPAFAKATAGRPAKGRWGCESTPEAATRAAGPSQARHPKDQRFRILVLESPMIGKLG